MNDYKKIVESWPKKWRTRNALKHPEIIGFLDSKYPGIDLNIQLASYIEDKSPFCCVCNAPLKMLRNTTCSRKCMSVYIKNNAEHYTELKQQGMLKKYGVKNPRHIDGMDDRIKNTMLEKYGGLVSEKSRESTRQRAPELNKKGRKTLKEKYGVDNPGQLPDHTEKCKNTLIANYGVTNYYQSDHAKAMMEKRKADKYSSFCPETIEFLGVSDDQEKMILFENANQLINYRCLQCNNTDAIPSETFKWRIRNLGTSCIRCALSDESGFSKGSVKERRLAEFVESLGVTIKRNHRILDGGKEIDIFCPDQRIGIEFNGLYWHNDLRIDKKYHAEKTKLAKEKGITLIHVFEDEWETQENIVKSRIAALLGKTNNVIYARKCQVVEISLDQEKKFLNANHIQGYSRSSVKLGLLYQDNLVSVMTFSKPNKAKGQKKGQYDWELLRFCSLIDHIVIGGANKLLSYFVSKYNPNTILSFADSRWSTGNLYKTLKFIEYQHTAPNYWYINCREGTRIHRFSLRKNSTDNPALTEYENRLQQGYLRIWDCGSSKWVWTKK